MRIAPSLVLLSLSACGGAVPVQLVSGTVTSGFPGGPNQVRALRDGAVLASVPVDGSGAFLLAVPAATIRIELAGDTGHVAFLAAAGASGPADLELCRPGDVLALHDLSFCPSQAACIDATAALSLCQAQPANGSCVSCAVACANQIAALDGCRFGNGVDCTTAAVALADCENSGCAQLPCPCDELAAAATGACASACSRSSEPLALAATAPPASVGCGP